MKRIAFFFSAWFGLTVICPASVPPAEQLLPAEVHGMLSVPNWTAAMRAYDEFPLTRFWHDPAMKGFREKFMRKFQADVIEPMQRELGVQLKDYGGLMQGQFTMAITPGTGGDATPGFVLLFDSGDKRDQLRTALTDLKKRWTDAGKPMKAERLRDVEFTTLILSSADLARTFAKALPGTGASPAAGRDEGEEKKTEFSIGQSGPLLLAGTDLKAIEKILIRQSGGFVPSLAELPAYEANHNARFRDSLVFGWMNVRSLQEVIVQQTFRAQSRAKSNPMAPRPDRLMQSLGLSGLQSIAWNVRQSPDGTFGGLYLDVPEADRRGLLKILTAENKEAAPLPFVGSEVVKFNRWRLDGQKIWSTLEAMVGEIFPPISGLLQLTLESAGKDRDPNFDLRKMLIGNLCDDIISIEKPARTSKLSDLQSPPKLVLLGSPRAEELAAALRTGTHFLFPPVDNESPGEREFLGRKIYSMPLPAKPSFDGSRPVPQRFHFAGAGGYLAMSLEVALVEEFVRGTQPPGRPLREFPGLGEAAQRVGGMNSGLFGYENRTENLRLLFELLRQDPGAFEKLYTSNVLTPGEATPQSRKNREEWLDFALLPPFDTVAKYFHFTVYGGDSGPGGLSFTVFSPTPPQLRN
jgi:hypothetical protein